MTNGSPAGLCPPPPFSHSLGFTESAAEGTAATEKVQGIEAAPAGSEGIYAEELQ